MRWKILAILVLVVGTVAALNINWHQPGNPNIVTHTMGGQQFWTDKVYHVGWRIQHNVVTDHYRLLDPENRRHAWGTLEECQQAFAAVRAQKALSYDGKSVVFMIKGLGGMEDSFARLQQAMAADGHHVVYVAYPSTRQGIQHHARDITTVLNSLEGVDDILFVAHSMGGLVMRQVLGDGGPWQDRINVRGLVMIGTPNQGADLAERFKDHAAFEWATTEAGQDLRPENVAALPGVTVRHCLVIGSTEGGEGMNPLIDGDDDGVVAVKTALLPGSDDIVFVDEYHRQLPNHADTIAAIRRFMDGGRCQPAGSVP